METNELYIGVMYAKAKSSYKPIRMFLVTPIIGNSLFSTKPIVKGFKEAITNTILIKGSSNRDINNKNIIWDILNKKADNLLSKAEIQNYINTSKEDMEKILFDSKEEADSIVNKYTKIKTK